MANASRKATGASLRLEDPLRFKFTPSADSPLVGTGVAHPPYTAPAAAPSRTDVGAYQSSAGAGAPADPYWVPGCTFTPACAS